MLSRIKSARLAPYDIYNFKLRHRHCDTESSPAFQHPQSHEIPRQARNDIFTGLLYKNYAELSGEIIVITLLGSTGSIGTQSLEVIENLGDNIFALCANLNTKLLEFQVRKYKPVYCAVYDEKKANDFKIAVKDTSTKVVSGIEGIKFIASHNNTGLLINALMGQIGLEPTLAAIKAKKRVALANKETLVVGGEIVMKEARDNGVDILPIDSEHCAIRQCIKNEKTENIKKIILTASGGPFYGKSRAELSNITPEDALKHPTWKMGRKITVDSATMMNKGLELIEACHLFNIAPDKISAVIHRQSIIHSLVEFIDKSSLAQLSLPDIRICIQYAVTGCERRESSEDIQPLDLIKAGSLTFQEPDNENFPLLELSRYVIKEGGTLPAAMNKANEVAVELFLKGELSFLGINDYVQEAVAKHKNIKNPKIEDLILLLK